MPDNIQSVKVYFVDFVSFRIICISLRSLITVVRWEQNTLRNFELLFINAVSDIHQLLEAISGHTTEISILNFFLRSRSNTAQSLRRLHGSGQRINIPSEALSTLFGQSQYEVMN